jgi:MFS family permease
VESRESVPATVTPRYRRAPLVALLAANAVSAIGTAMTWVALPWFVLETTGSAAQTGLAGFALLLPGFIAGVFGGAAVDRLGFKRASVIADLMSGTAIALIPFLHQTVGLAFWQLLVLIFLGSLLEVPGFTARRSLLPELADLAGVRLERVNALYEGNQQLAGLLGPPLAGLLVLWLGASNVLWVDAATFLISAIAVAGMVPSMTQTMGQQRGRYLDEVVTGLRFLRRDRLLLALAAGLGVSNFFGSPLIAVVLPVYAQRVLGSVAELGGLLGVMGAGALAGTLLYGMIGHRLPRRAVWLAAFLVFPLTYWVLLIEPSWVVMGTVFAFVGFIGGPINPLAVTVRHERIPAELRGRVFATFSAMAMVAAPLGIVLSGYLIDRAGIETTALALAVGSQLLGLGMLAIPAYRDLNRDTTTEQPTGDQANTT